jgi:hypothetical protein
MRRLRWAIMVLGALVVALVAASTSTGAGAAGAGARAIPSSAQVLEVTVRRPHRPPVSEVSVTRPAQVRHIASLIDGLKTQQAGALDCTGRADDPVVTFTFRAVLGGRVLARAIQIVDRGVGRPACEPMTLTVRGRPQTPLLGGAGVVRDAQRLLGIRVPRG